MDVGLADKFSLNKFYKFPYSDINMNLELVPGLKSEPLFRSSEDYEAFRQRFYNAVQDTLREQALARAQSERNVMNHWVD